MRTTNDRLRIRTLAAIGGVLLLVSACSSAGSSAAPAASSAPSAAPVSAPASAGAPGIYSIGMATGTVGAYLTGPNGNTLYTFKPDSANTSTCTDTCAQNWPPLTVEADDTLKGGDGVAGALTSFKRADGSMQVAYNGVPLYYFAGDTKAGDTNGQGKNDKWFVASPTGAAPGGSAAPSTDGGGYGKGTY